MDINEIAIKLKTTLPANWEKAYGYSGDESQILIYWEPCGDEAMIETALQSSSGGNWNMFLEINDILDPEIRLGLMALGYEEEEPYPVGVLGSSEDIATHALLLDLPSREIWLAPIRELRRYLASLLPEVEPVRMSPEELEAWGERIYQNLLAQDKAIKAKFRHGLRLCPPCHGAGWIGDFKSGYALCPKCKGERLLEAK